MEMAKTPNDEAMSHLNKAHAVYLEKKGSWFWVEMVGQRVIYYGPYHSRAAANKFRDDPDAYAASGWARDDE